MTTIPAARRLNLSARKVPRDERIIASSQVYRRLCIDWLAQRNTIVCCELSLLIINRVRPFEPLITIVLPYQDFLSLAGLGQRKKGGPL